MKTFSTVLLSFVVAISAQAQGYTPGPVSKNALVQSGPFVVAGASTTNIPAALQIPFGIGRSGLGLGGSLGGTNSVTTTNTVIVVELSGNATEYFDNNRLTVGIPCLGTGPCPFYTNWPSTTVNLDNAILARIRSIQNTNIDSIFITNLYFNTR